MLDPATIGASVIAKLAFETFVKTGAGEAAKATVAQACGLIEGLRDHILHKFQGNQRATSAIAEVEQQGSEEALAKVTKYLDLEMDEEPKFAHELRQMAQQIINIQNQSMTTLNQQNINYGRDQNVINQPQGDIRIGGT